jgi:hypothetical protein
LPLDVSLAIVHADNVTADRYFAVIAFAAKHGRDSRCPHRFFAF